VWPEGHLSRYLEEASVRACVPRLHVANWRQITVAIVKTKFASQIECFDPDDGDEDAEEIDPIIRSMTDQRNHKTRTVNRAYANQAGAVFSNLWDGKVRMGLQASTLWQDFWGVGTVLKRKKRGRTEQESRLTKRVAKGIYRPRKPWSSEALLGGLKKLYGNKEAGWKSREQEKALTTIMSWTEQVVAILPTGAGKSLLFMLPYTLPDAGVTILVVPLVSLHGDMLRRVREMKIDHLEWQPGESREAALILVSAETVSSKDFMKYGRRLVAEQKLDRIVVDECHLTVVAAEYRPSIIELTAIRSLRTQFVYLTATLLHWIHMRRMDRPCIWIDPLVSRIDQSLLRSAIITFGAVLANRIRRGLIHDSASGPAEFSGPRCIFPFRSSAFHEPSCLSPSA
jgi:hypothetical protein